MQKDRIRLTRREVAIDRQARFVYVCVMLLDDGPFPKIDTWGGREREREPDGRGRWHAKWRAHLRYQPADRQFSYRRESRPGVITLGGCTRTFIVSPNRSAVRSSVVPRTRNRRPLVKLTMRRRVKYACTMQRARVPANRRILKRDETEDVGDALPLRVEGGNLLTAKMFCSEFFRLMLCYSFNSINQTTLQVTDLLYVIVEFRSDINSR